MSREEEGPEKIRMYIYKFLGVQAPKSWLKYTPIINYCLYFSVQGELYCYYILFIHSMTQGHLTEGYSPRI